MPIRVGSRLEQLIALHRRIGVEIELEQRNVWRDMPGHPDTRPARPTARPSALLTRNDAHLLMARLGLTAKVVRVWAREHGHEPGVRGSLQIEVVQAYVDAHAEGVTE